MFTVKKYIIGLLIGTMIFSGIAIVDDMIVKISMAAASSVAFTVVGSFYSAGLITSKAEGGKARMIIFVILLCFFQYVFTQIAKGIIWLFSFPIWIYIAILSFSIAVLILVMLYKDKKVKQKYNAIFKIENRVDDSSEQTLNKSPSVDDNPIVKYMTIRELLKNEKNLDYIKAYHNNPHSPGLEYVKVYKSALNHSKIKGYIKMDNATAFWGDVYYAEDRRWMKFDY
ncbi:hypothetical protein HF295_07615 [Hujiaoplasma nucleasis]|uniref:Uncharacterized protein n=1 Tax=Hujiaoplasma nucleasis TaxID=2725268 RepID=A0A7L6N3G8_9MOLU|nr:hypothetical protein [Hujiaoplasma nucleasis]QLY40723.1 hypothetical protein HF295_07615 [Hujiaoplasma nucleasis]